ncbi:uncharacterized protein LOC134238929 [Saccostrea cucullata]|uniref:uncharacterized protein LOC134238929 n=1 Tax=Saccostrea cuccullata TaxID=36930 RepID=UPI002ED3A800
MPGMCCPNGVTVETIFEECAVKLCNMTESDYNQTEVCQSADKCSTATQQTIPLSTKLFSTTTRTSPPTRSTQRPSTITDVVSLPLTSRSSIQAFPSSKHGEPVQDKNLALPRPFGKCFILNILRDKTDLEEAAYYTKGKCNNVSIEV